jgi:NAD(P)H-dependent FMN reductase
MLKVLAIGASNSKESINKKFASYTANLIENAKVTTVDLNDYPLPIYGIDLEKEEGIPENAKKFSEQIKNADGIVLSLAEHNSNFSVVFKNLTDWMSRMEVKTWQEKNILLLSTSPGGRGGASVMQIALASFPYAGAQITSHFSLPKFYEHFTDSGISDSELKSKYLEAVATFQKAINK